VSIGSGPYSWGQVPTPSPTLASLGLDLLPQTTAGTLLYQVFLRGFADGNRYVVEYQGEGGVRLDLDGAAKTMVHKLARPLAVNVPADRGPAAFTFEIDLSWQADAGSPALALATLPRPLAGV
jgi:hypothetical protein